MKGFSLFDSDLGSQLCFCSRAHAVEKEGVCRIRFSKERPQHTLGQDLMKAYASTGEAVSPRDAYPLENPCFS